MLIKDKVLQNRFIPVDQELRFVQIPRAQFALDIQIFVENFKAFLPCKCRCTFPVLNWF